MDPGLDEQLVELAYEFYALRMHKDVMYAYGWFKPPAKPLPEGATSLGRLIHLVGRCPGNPGGPGASLTAGTGESPLH